MSSRAPYVTQHALRRWVQHVLKVKGLPDDDGVALQQAGQIDGIDLAAIETTIVKVTMLGVSLGAVSVIAKGHRLILKGKTVMTVVPRKRQRGRRPRDLDNG